MTKEPNININEKDIINLFGNAYEIAREIFDVEPINSSAKEQKQIRKWICKNYPVYETFPFLNKHTDDNSIIDFIHGIYTSFKEKNEEPKRFFYDVKDFFSDDVISAFLDLIDYSYIYSNFIQSESTIKIHIDNCAAYSRVLTLIDCEALDFGEYHCIDFSGSTFTKNDEYFVITATLENFDTETSYPIVFKFKNAKIEIISYNATETTTPFPGSPFGMLSMISSEIIEKNKTSSDNLNQKEKDLLPLLEEISDLSMYDDFKRKTYPLIKELATNIAPSKFVELVEELENAILQHDKLSKILHKIYRETQKPEYEPLWRKLFNLIADSQNEYPKKADALLPKDYIDKLRTEITSLMHQNGYIGNYPDFSKVTDLKSIRTADCHGEPFTIFNEKNAKLYIRCIEDVSVTGKISILILTGTALNKKDVNTIDAYSCLFYKRGKLFNNSVSWNDFNESEFSIQQIVNIAFKKSELKKLTKEERKADISLGNGCLPLYLGMGVAFGGLFTILFAIFIFFFIWLIEDLNSALEIIKIAPWWLCFLASGGLFGIAMFLISLHTQRK